MGSFQKLKIFENNAINIICDKLTEKIEEITEEKPNLCGSVAKYLHGALPKDYTPKDVDFVVSKWDYRLLTHQLDTVEGVLMIEKKPEKILLYTVERICIEIWYLTDYNKNMKQYQYKDLIPYLYGRN